MYKRLSNVINNNVIIRVWFWGKQENKLINYREDDGQSRDSVMVVGKRSGCRLVVIIVIIYRSALKLLSPNLL